jgi:hypothetical protein
MLLLHLLYLGCLLRHLGRPVQNLFYLYIVGVLIFLQYTLFKNPLPQVVTDEGSLVIATARSCFRESPA